MRLWRPLVLVGCFSGALSDSCRPRARTEPISDAATPEASRGNRVVAPLPVLFARPVAAVHSTSGGTFVAGLAPARAVVVASMIGADGASLWTRDVFQGVSASGNPTLTVLPTSTGALVVWRGPANGKEATLAAGISLKGDLEGEPVAVSSAACTTREQLIWVERGTQGASNVRTRRFGEPASILALGVPEGRDLGLVCAEHRGFGLAEGVNDVVLHVVGATAKRAPVPVIQEATFGGDEERAHETYTFGEVLGIVRLGLSGNVAVREVSPDGVSPWRRLRSKLMESDDIAAVDADGRIGVLAFTREPVTSDAATMGNAVRAVTWERAGTQEVTREVAPADASHDRGPFWSGAVAGGVAIAWVERTTGDRTGRGSISALSYATLAADGVGDLRHVPLVADDMVDASCDGIRCYAVALVRSVEEETGTAEMATVIAYP